MSTADAVAIVLSLLALWIAALAYWRTFGVWISIIEVNGGSSGSAVENNGEIFHLYTVTLKNLGIPLHDMSISLGFDGQKGKRFVAMQAVEFGNEHKKVSVPDVFGHGMIGTYTLRSYVPYVRSLRDLDCPSKRNARIVVRSQGYLAAEIPLWCRFYCLRSFWNRLAYKFNSLFDRTEMRSDGVTMCRRRKILPSFNTDKHFRLYRFVQNMAADNTPLRATDDGASASN